MKKWAVILIISLVLAAVLAGGLYYANAVLLPRVVRQKILQGISDFTSSPATIGDLRLNILKGLVIRDLIVYDKTSPQEPLLEVKELSTSFLIWPFLKKKTIILPALTIDQAVLTLRRRNDGTLNIGYLLDKFKSQKTGAAAPAILVKNVEITESSVRWTDETKEPPHRADVRIKHANARIGFTRASLTLTGEVTKNNLTTSVSINGDYVFSGQGLKGHITLKDFDIKNYLDEFPAVPHLPSRGIIDSLEADFTFDGLKTLSSQVQLHAKGLEASYRDYFLSGAEMDINFSFSAQTDHGPDVKGEGHMDLLQATVATKTPLSGKIHIAGAQADVRMEENVITIVSDLAIRDSDAQTGDIKISGVNGSIHAEAQIPYPVTSAQEKQTTYKGRLDIASGDAEGLPFVQTMKILSAQASFDNAAVILAHLTAETLGTTVVVAGSLKNNVLDLQASGTVALASLLPALKKQFEIPVKTASGEADANIHLTSNIAEKKVSVQGEASLREPVLHIRQPDMALKAGAGRIVFDTQNETASWKLENTSFLNRTFILKGKLAGFKTSTCDIDASSEDFSATARFTKTGDIYDVSSLKMSFKKSRLDAYGRWDSKQNTLHVNAVADVNLPDLKEWLPDKALFEKPWAFSGLCHIQTDVSGAVRDWKSWTVSSTATADALQVRGFTVKNIALNYTQRSRQGFINFLDFNAYDGKGTVKGRLDLKTSALPYTLSGEIKALNLNLLKNDIPNMKDKTFYGTLDLQAVASGSGADTKSITGQGQLFIRNGNIWEFNPLKGLGNFIFVPRFNTLSFSHATGDFFVRDGWILTDNLELIGQDAELLVRGKIGFDGTLDLVAVTQAPTTGPGQSPIGDIIKASGGMTAISITGSIEKPQYKLQPITKNIFNKIQGFFSNIAP